MELKKYYLSMYRVYMVELYDKGYISDPTRINCKELYSNIHELGINGMFDTFGEIFLTTPQVTYAMYKHKNSEEIMDFLSILYKALKYREYSIDIDNLYDNYNFSEFAKGQVCLGLKQRGAKIECKTGFGISRAIIACLLKQDETAVCENFNSELWDIAMEELGIPADEWHEDGLIASGLSHEEEVDCIELILEGNVEVSGKYAKVFQDWMYEHKWKQKGMTNNCKGLYDYIFSSRAIDILEIESRILNSLNDSDRKVYAIVGGQYYTSKKISTYNIPMGSFIVSSGEDDVMLFDGALLSGYTGEVYSLEYLEEEGIMFIGCPIELYTNPKEKFKFFDIEQVDIKSDTWFSNPDIDLFFEEELPEKVQEFNPESIEEKIYEIYRQSQIGNLIGKLDSLEGVESAKKNVMKYLE